MPRVKGRLRTWNRFFDESGQMLVLMGAGLAAFVAIVGISVDVGQVVFTRTDLQKVADAAAFAGAQDLPSASSATTNANTYVGLNASNTTAAVAISQTYNANDTIQVTATRKVDYAFLRVVGLKGTTVSARAKVRVGTYNGGSGIVPWGLVASSNKDFLGNNCFDKMVDGVPTFKQNQKCTLKYGAGSNSGGDFGALALDGTGANEYRDDIVKGSTKKFEKGQKVEAQTGNMVGPTGQGIADRLAIAPPSTCNTNERNQILHTVDGKTSIVAGCENHPRILIIPVVDKIDNPAQSTILGFAFMFLHGEAGGGGHTSVEMEFVSFVTAIPGGSYNGPANGSSSTAILLVE
jgi:Flp pilus assembly protein TadG